MCFFTSDSSSAVASYFFCTSDLPRIEVKALSRCCRASLAFRVIFIFLMSDCSSSRIKESSAIRDCSSVLLVFKLPFSLFRESRALFSSSASCLRRRFSSACILFLYCTAPRCFTSELCPRSMPSVSATMVCRCAMSSRLRFWLLPSGFVQSNTMWA